jgi:hypothetical protein
MASGIWLEVASSNQSRSISPAAHEAYRIEEFFGGGVAHNHFARIAGLVADIGGEVLRPGRGTEVEIERVELRAHKFVEHAGGKNTALPAPFTDQRKLACMKRF